MSDCATPDSGRREQPEARHIPQLPRPGVTEDPQGSGARSVWPLPAVIPPQPEARWSEPSRRAEPGRNRGGRRLAWIGMATAAVLVAGAALWVVADRRGQAAAVAVEPDRATSLARAVDALSARLSAIEGAKPADQLTDLRRSIAEIRSSLASSRELSGALAELSQKVDKLDREESVNVDKLGERVDHETSAKTAELAARIETLEKKSAAGTPGSSPAQARGPEAAAAEAPPQPAAKQTPATPKLGANIDTEPTGSIERPRPVLRGYIVLGAREDVALIEGRYGELAVRPGDVVPGAGRVERIARQRGAWVVVTEQGLIAPGYSAY